MITICEFGKCINSTAGNHYLDIIAIIISILSLLFTIAIFILNDHRAKQLNRINLAAEFFNSVFKEILISHIPQKREMLKWDKGRLVDYEMLCEAITSLSEKSRYYFYSKSKYYEELKKCIQDTEDCICGTANRTVSTVSEQEKALNDIDDKLRAIYHNIMKGLNGNEFK